MGFQAPWFLLGLALVPLGVWAYLAHARRERAAARLFTSEAVAPAVAPRRPRWRRHAPPALYAVGLAALLVALARPQATVAVPVEQASIVLATDVSGSMQAKDVAPSRLEAARSAAKAFVAKVPRRINVGVIAFNQAPSVLQRPTTDRAAVRSALGQLAVSGGTATGDALSTALAQVRGNGADRKVPAAIVLLSDGASTRGRDAVAVARKAKEAGVPVSTISLGTSSGTIEVTDANGVTRTEQVPPDPRTMQQVAEVSGGKAYRTADATALSEVYEKLGSELAEKNEPRELTAGVAGIALLLVLGGGGLSLRWFGRLA
ncbi:MAG: VWA domain-containing protein [Solirubrobacterales bacterium]|nr:VWA domain-containing protein [Solirubrobacterales bacterium]